MPALYPPFANGIFRIGAASLLLAAVSIPAALVALMRAPEITDEGYVIEQPVMFDHRHHVRDDGIDCRYCHATVDRSPYAGMPTTETCMGCHAQVWPESPLLAPVRSAWATGRPLVWNRVHRLPELVRFEHSEHVLHGVACVSCHGHVEDMALVRAVHPMQMRWCIDCHRDPKEHAGLEDVRPSVDCSACHM